MQNVWEILNDLVSINTLTQSINQYGLFFFFFYEKALKLIAVYPKYQ